MGEDKVLEALNRGLRWANAYEAVFWEQAISDYQKVLVVVKAAEKVPRFSSGHEQEWNDLKKALDELRT